MTDFEKREAEDIADKNAWDAECYRKRMLTAEAEVKCLRGVLAIAERTIALEWREKAAAAIRALPLPGDE